ncbi:TIGR00282 family metallophosphoesterase [bacterium]|nr:TIGR00282 family metallophosphoesterase [bacterium]
MKILFIGDVIGEPGRKVTRQLLPQIKSTYQPDLTVLNGENAAGGFGLTAAVADELFSSGIDVLTSGNHIWDKKQIMETLEKDRRILRPANYPVGSAGRGWGIYEPKLGAPKIGVLNLEGRVYMHNLDDPFTLGKSLLDEMRKETPIILVDFHAEVTSEKRALGWYLDGLATAVIGTHTHVQTADEEILPNGTAYLTDAGMTGGRDSVIGVKKEDAIHRFLYQTPSRFSPATGNPWLNGVFIEADPATGKALKIERIQESL